MLSIFSDKLKGIAFDKYGITFSSEYLLSNKHNKSLLKWVSRLNQMKIPSTDLEFGKLRVDLESWYYQLGGTEIKFEYHDSYLLTPKMAAEQLGGSKVTLNKYIKQGLEAVQLIQHPITKYQSMLSNCGKTLYIP